MLTEILCSAYPLFFTAHTYIQDTIHLEEKEGQGIRTKDIISNRGGPVNKIRSRVQDVKTVRRNDVNI